MDGVLEGSGFSNIPVAAKLLSCEVPDEYVPTEAEMRSQLEGEVFGSVEFGEVVRRRKVVR